ncbi:MAG TPA: RNA polymerase subunit sigma-70 [Dehalococcoidia bacterium]|jgi:RNA polymerase sigma-70 factor (ECF subfamily)
MEENHLAAAQAGDERAFAALTQPLQRELHVHCYRMLGSLDDADDALQETLLRAWQQLGRFEPRAPLRAWLYRIATNVCLTLLARRARRGEVFAADLEEDAVRLTPYPDHLLDELGPSATGPEALIEQRESVELAFIAAVQILPPRQRATLLLRDVIGYSAVEVATTLASSVAGVNSALQRARATLAHERSAGRVSRAHTRTGTAIEQALVRRLADAWHAADVPAIVALLTEDAVVSMPPLPGRHVGHAAIGDYLSQVMLREQLNRRRLVPTRANRQPALAAYRREDGATGFQAYSILVLALEGEAIASMVHFADPALFERFDLPASIPG